MLRFLPDGWLETLLRPFIMADPSAGIYFEDSAPDLRFALLAVFLALGLLARRRAAAMTGEQWRLVLALFTVFYVWTLVIGNGRYFVAGLLLVGPLLVAAWRALPGTRALRAVVLAGAAVLQIFVVLQVYTPGRWGIVRWRSGPGLAIEASELRRTPAVFVTITGMSYSALVPAFDRRSRWSNIAGQRDITPGTFEYPRLRALLASDLPKYLVAPLNPQYMTADLQPDRGAREVFVPALAAQGLELSGAACRALRSDLTFGPPNGPSDEAPKRGFWICPLRLSATPSGPALPAAPWPAEIARVFDRIEQRCPRFFPPGDGRERHFDGIWMRHYPVSDVRLYIDDRDQVLYRYFRALNPTFVGSADQVRRGEFKIACDKVAGRYRLPWLSD